MSEPDDKATSLLPHLLEQGPALAVPAVDEVVLADGALPSDKIPPKRREMPLWASDYMDALVLTLGMRGKAADLVGIDRKTVHNEEVVNPDFERAVAEVKRRTDPALLTELEQTSIAYALTPKGVADRIFLMKSLNPAKYREKTMHSNSGAKFKVVYGFQIGPGEAQAGTKIAGAVTVEQVGSGQ